MSFGALDRESCVGLWQFVSKACAAFLTSASFQVHVLPMNLNCVPGRSTKVQFLVLIVERHITCGIETNDASIDKGTGERIIDEIVIRRVFINATAERAINARVSVIMPGLSRLKSI